MFGQLSTLTTPWAEIARYPCFVPLTTNNFPKLWLKK
nr:MAG: ORF3 [Torque teno polar bear virus 13]